VSTWHAPDWPNPLERRNIRPGHTVKPRPQPLSKRALSGAFGADDQADDVLALLDAFELNRVGLVGDNIGGAVIQALARMPPNRVEGLLFFDFVYPGIDACETVAFLNAAFPAPKLRERSVSASHVQEPSEFRRSIRP